MSQELKVHNLKLFNLFQKEMSYLTRDGWLQADVPGLDVENVLGRVALPPRDGVVEGHFRVRGSLIAPFLSRLYFCAHHFMSKR